MHNWTEEAKAAWLAAMIDADGWIVIAISIKHNRDNKPRIEPKIGITNACKDIRDFADSIAGMKTTTTKNNGRGIDSRKIKTNNTVYEITWRSAPILLALLDIIEPYLIRKKTQAGLMRTYLEGRITKNGSVHRSSRQYTLDDFAMAEQVSRLNGRVPKWESYIEGEQVYIRRRTV